MLYRAGVVCGHDMTTEAALTKMIYLFGKGYSAEQIKKVCVNLNENNEAILQFCIFVP